MRLAALSHQASQAFAGLSIVLYLNGPDYFPYGAETAQVDAGWTLGLAAGWESEPPHEHLSILSPLGIVSFFPLTPTTAATHLFGH